MGILTLIYDADFGTPHRDGTLNNVVDTTIEVLKLSDTTITTATENILHAFRLAVRQNRISHKNIAIVYRFRDDGPRPVDMCIPIDRQGNLWSWPEGFADYQDKIILQLI